MRSAGCWQSPHTQLHHLSGLTTLQHSVTTNIPTTSASTFHTSHTSHFPRLPHLSTHSKPTHSKPTHRNTSKPPLPPPLSRHPEQQAKPTTESNPNPTISPSPPPERHQLPQRSANPNTNQTPIKPNSQLITTNPLTTTTANSAPRTITNTNLTTLTTAPVPTARHPHHQLLATGQLQLRRKSLNTAKPEEEQQQED